MAVSLSTVLPALSIVLDGSAGKESTCNAGDTRDEGLIPRSDQGSPGAGNGNQFHSSCLGNPTDRRAWWATAQGVTGVRHD